MHPKIPDIQRMIRRDRSAPHDRRDHRDPGPLCQLCKLCVRPGNVHSASCQEERALCFSKHLECLLKLSDMHLRIRPVSADIDLRRIFRASKLSHHILRQVDENRPRPSRPCDVECLLYDTPQVFPVADGYSILGNTPGNPYDVNLLECIVSYQMSCHLSGKAH